MLSQLLARLDTTPYIQYAIEYFPQLCCPGLEASDQKALGTVGVVGGSKGMVGAAWLAAKSALLAGCGKVVVGLNQNPAPTCHTCWELISDYAFDVVEQYKEDVDTWVVGCGLMHDENAKTVLQTIWYDSTAQLVFDAGALLILAEHSQLFPNNKRADLVLTPNLNEAACLLATSMAQIESNRSWAARELASRYRAWVILKGHETIISSSRGFLLVNQTGNSGLARIGSGDVLVGLVGSLLAQGIVAEQAVPAAVWLHGIAAEVLAAARIGPIGLLASELPEVVRWLRNRLIVNQ